MLGSLWGALGLPRVTSVLRDQEQGQDLGSTPHAHIERATLWCVLTLWWSVEQPELDSV